MRLPTRHPPPEQDAPLRRCAHLEALIGGAIGLPLRPAAEMLDVRRSRGRYGNALQWHLGLESHDSDAALDWEDRIEIKLVSVWRRGGRVVADKLKVCDASQDPARKLSNLVLVFADRLTRVVVGARHVVLAGDRRQRLVDRWGQDPHFGDPALYIESRDGPEGSSPAYYLTAGWFMDEGLLPDNLGVWPFDGRWSSECRGAHGGRDPLLAVVPAGGRDAIPCPRCHGTLKFDPGRVAEEGWAPAHHGLPHGERCALHAHGVVDAARLVQPHACTAAEQRAGIESRVAREELWRLTDRVLEPEDHLH